MRTTLVDNLTLEAVERILGNVLAEYYDEKDIMLDEDIIAFDNLLNAILFSDEIVYVESFMPENGNYTAQREYFPRFRQYRLGIVSYRTIIKDINDEFALKYDKDIKNTPAFFTFEFMKPHVQLPAINKLEYGSLVYHTISANLGTDLVLFPSRETFQRRLMKDFVNELKTKPIDSPFYMEYPSPFFISWFAQNYKDPSKFIDAAYELKKEPEFVELRGVLDRLKNSTEMRMGSFFRRKLQEKDFRRKVDKLSEKYGVVTEEGRLERILTVAYNMKCINQGFVPIPGKTFEEAGYKSLTEEDMELYDIGTREEHYVHLGSILKDKRELEKFGILYDYITSDLVLAGSPEAKIFNEAMLIDTFRINRKEAKEIYRDMMGDGKIAPLEFINHKDVTLSEETLKILKEMGKD